MKGSSSKTVRNLCYCLAAACHIPLSVCSRRRLSFCSSTSNPFGLFTPTLFLHCYSSYCVWCFLALPDVRGVEGSCEHVHVVVHNVCKRQISEHSAEHRILPTHSSNSSSSLSPVSTYIPQDENTHNSLLVTLIPEH